MGQVAGGQACNPKPDGDGRGSQNLSPAALPCGARMRQESHRDEGEDEGVERGRKAVVELGP